MLRVRMKKAAQTIGFICCGIALFIFTSLPEPGSVAKIADLIGFAVGALGLALLRYGKEERAGRGT